MRVITASSELSINILRFRWQMSKCIVIHFKEFTVNMSAPMVQQGVHDVKGRGR